MIHAIIFSKDRPWQLKEYLRTLILYIKGDYQISVIYKASTEELQKAYTHLENSYFGCYPQINFENESKKSFEQLFRDAVKKPSRYILFGVDDVLFYNRFNLDDAASYLDIYSEVEAVSLRLHLGITYCQPGNCCSRPNLITLPGDNNQYYVTTGGMGDFGYGFDLSASLYRQKDIVSLLDLPEAKLDHPNNIEGYLASYYTKNNRNIIAFSKFPVCSTITINRVQEVCKNPLAGQEYSVDKLLEFYWDGKEYDETEYSYLQQNELQFNAIHIGYVSLKH